MQEIQWHYYPLVAGHAITRAFVESQVKRQKRPKTVDAYARNLEDLMRTINDGVYSSRGRIDRPPRRL